MIKSFNLKILILIVLLTGIICLLILLKLSSGNKPSMGPRVSAVPVPKIVDEAPRVTTSEDAAINLQSDPVKISRSEIRKLVSFLPFEQTYQLSTGVKVSLIIPSPALQNSDWALEVDVNGIDYQVAKDEEEIMKKSFIETSGKVFDWMKSKEVDPAKIYIVWGDRQFIRNRAQEWLKSQ